MKSKKVRTTVYLHSDLKKMIEIQAIEENTSMQAILNRALRKELQRASLNKKRKVEFTTLDLDLPDDLSRKDYY